MRTFLTSLSMVAVLTLVIAFPLACGSDTSSGTTSIPETATGLTPTPFPVPGEGEPQPVEQPNPYGAGSTASQSVGMLIDGLELRDIRWSDHGTYFRVVFEMGTPEGTLITQVPHADATMSPDGKQVKVVLGGIRSISDASNVTSTSLDIGDTEVTTIKRLPAQDDQALIYTIDLAKPSTYALAGLGSPGRIVIDITKT